MNPLVEHPQYFANGMFSIKHGNTIYSPDNWGIDGGTLCVFRDIEKPEKQYREVSYPLMPQVVLIARPIEDMTDEEVKNYPVTYGSGENLKPDQKWVIEEEADENKMLGRCERYLLSIGVYPFDQSHFDEDFLELITKK